MPVGKNQHAFGDFFERQGAGAIHHAGVVGHEGQAHGLRACGNDAYASAIKVLMDHLG